MHKRIPKLPTDILPAVLSFLFAQAASVLLAHFEKTTFALIISVITFIGILAFWARQVFCKQENTREKITPETIRRDIDKKIRSRNIVKLVGGVIVILLITAPVQYYIYRQSQIIHRPIMAISRTEKAMFYQGENLSDTISGFKIWWQNTGDRPAYNLQSLRAYAPANQPNNVMIFETNLNPSPIYQKEKTYIHFAIFEHPEIQEWFVYIKQTYAVSASAAGQSFEDERWFYYIRDGESLGYMTDEELQDFEYFVRKELINR